MWEVFDPRANYEHSSILNLPVPSPGGGDSRVIVLEQLLLSMILSRVQLQTPLVIWDGLRRVCGSQVNIAILHHKGV